MRATRRLAAPLAALILAAAPSAAVAQNAGDEQYADPFANEGGAQSGGGSNNSGSGGSGNSSGSSGSNGSNGSAGVAGTTAQATPSAQTTTPSTSAAQTTASAEELPRTGLDAGVVAAVGAALLLTGLALRRRLGDARR
jgi:hypothetical protein